MKKWRNAATVILAASKSPAFTNASLYSGCDSDFKELYKEKTDFQILALKKSSESPILPGNYVFPGGTFNAADSSEEWIQLFKKFGYCVDALCKLLNNSNSKLPIFENGYTNLPNSISLRITAIRETFEECGILLCKRTTTINERKPVVSTHLNIKDIAIWRKKVLKNPKEFLNLCLFNDCYPDVASIFLWSNWLTPSPFPIRFNSIFFMAFLENLVEATPDDYEIKSLKWISPRDLLSAYHDGTVKIHHPQLYEISRLASFNSFLQLLQFSYDLNGMESEMWMPVRMFLKDGVISVLPGDELYPNPPDYFAKEVIIIEDSTIESFDCAKMNRIVLPNDEKVKIIANNLSKTYGHVLPWCPDIKFHIHGNL